MDEQRVLEKKNSIEFSQSLAESIEGCSRLLYALHLKVTALSKNPDQPSTREKFVVLWTESGVREISDSLHCQATALLLLLQWYELC